MLPVVLQIVTQKKKDFSCSDRKFAHNIGIKFMTPEEFFLGETKKEAFDWQAPDINEELNRHKTVGTAAAGPPSFADVASDKQEMVVVVGFPGSGKSTFCKKYLLPKGYVHVNRDTLIQQAKCYKVATEALEQGKSVVIDNTNPSDVARSKYVQIAKDCGVPVRCFWFNISQDLAEHMNMYRERASNGKEKHVPKIGYNIYKKQFVPPSKREGFVQVKEISFVPSFDSDKDLRLFKQLA